MPLNLFSVYFYPSFAISCFLTRSSFPTKCAVVSTCLSLLQFNLFCCCSYLFHSLNLAAFSDVRYANLSWFPWSSEVHTCHFKILREIQDLAIYDFLNTGKISTPQIFKKQISILTLLSKVSISFGMHRIRDAIGFIPEGFSI